MSIFPLLLLGGAAYLVMNKKKGGGDPHVQTFPNKAAAGKAFEGDMPSGGAVIFVFRGYTKDSANVAVIEEVRQTLRVVSAKYPNVSFIEYPDKTVGNAIGGTLGIRIGDRGPEYMHLDSDPEGPWMILNSNEAAGEFDRAAQWAAGRIEVPGSVAIADITPAMALELAEGLFGTGGGGSTRHDPPPDTLVINVMGSGSNWTWFVGDIKTQETIIGGEASSEAEARAEAESALKEIRGQS